MDLQDLAIALIGGVAGGVVALEIQRRQTIGSIRLHLFVKRAEAYDAMVGRLAAVHEAVLVLTAQAGPNGEIPEKLRLDFREHARPLLAAVVNEMNRRGLFLDKRGGVGIIEYVGLIGRVAEADENLTAEQAGSAFGEALSACHDALSIPKLAQETYREAARLGRRFRRPPGG